MGYYLLDHPNPHGDHFYRSRRGTVVAIVVHITAGLEDLDRRDDRSAEATARYAATTDRKVSWHSGSDADSHLELLPPDFTAFHCQNYNSRTYGHEISKKHTDWTVMDPEWVTATLRNAAAHLGPMAARLRVPIRKTTRAEIDRAIAGDGRPVGFVGHHELDPSRRSDPGLIRGTNTFPWDRFLNLCRDGAPDQQQEDDMTPEQASQLWETWQRTKNLEGTDGFHQQIQTEILERVKALETRPGGVDVDRIADLVVERLAERLKD